MGEFGSTEMKGINGFADNQTGGQGAMFGCVEGALRLVSEVLMRVPREMFMWRLREVANTSCLNVTPTRSGAAVIEVVVRKGKGDRAFSVNIGEGARLDFDTDIYGDHLAHWQAFFRNLILAVVEGRVREELVFRGQRLVKCTFVAAFPGDSFCYTRWTCMAVVKGFFQRTTIKRVQYLPYV